MTLPTLALPGQPLDPETALAPGPGTLQLNTGALASSLLGTPTVHKSKTTDPTTKKSTTTKILTVIPSPRSSPALPQTGATVYARITRLERLLARCAILVVGDAVVGGSQPLRAVIRAQDVRATEKDKVKVVECFHVGDVVRATVLGLGDQGGYYLGTAGNEFGVVMAWSEAGNGCVPMSWREVRDVETGVVEGRKVAKPV